MFVRFFIKNVFFLITVHIAACDVPNRGFRPNSFREANAASQTHENSNGRSSWRRPGGRKTTAGRTGPLSTIYASAEDFSSISFHHCYGYDDNPRM